MRRLAPLHTKPGRHRPASQSRTVCIVDSNADSYEGWQSTAEARGLRLRFCASAEQALRFSLANAVDLWVVNTRLPGLSGFELCSMLKAQSTSATVLLVADEYTIEAERRAWAQRATMFCCVATLDQHIEAVLAKQRNSARRETL